MKKQPKGRTLAEFRPLSVGELALLKACAEGEVAMLTGHRPTEKTEENKVRASFIRMMALRADDKAPLHERGVQLFGAWVEGEFNLNAATAPAHLSIRNSHFESPPMLEEAQIEGILNFSGSSMPGLQADGLQCKGAIFLSDGFSALGEIRLLGTRIGGDLDCTGAQLNGNDGDALSVDRAVIQGGVFLSSKFTAIGTVRLLGVQIGSNLDCSGAHLNGKSAYAISVDGAVIAGDVFLSDGFTATGSVRLLGAQIGGDLDCTGAKLDGAGEDALNIQGITVDGAFIFRSLVSPAHSVSLLSAKVGRLIDDAASWGSDLALSGFVYEHLAGNAPTDAQTRLVWLGKQSTRYISPDSFRPQPWKQLQKILRAMGHTEDARQVAIAFEDRLRKLHLIGQTPAHWPEWRRAPYRNITKMMHWSFKILMGYGYRPLRLGAWMLAVWLFCAAIYWAAALQGVMAPSNPLVFQNLVPYASCEPNWYLCEALPEAYTGFSPLAYSLDLLLPVVNLHQETDWGPLTPTPLGIWYHELLANWSFKHVVRLVIWFEILFGWIASLLLVAVVSGLTKRSED